MADEFWSGQVSIVDFLIFFGTIIISLSIGLYFGCKDRKKISIVDYFLGGRKLTVLPTAFSLVVTYQSSLMIIGAPAEVYSYGLKYTYLFLAAILSFTFAGFTIVPVFQPLKLTSVYRYFELRYGERSVRYVLMCAGMLSSLLYMGIVTFGTCVALEVILHIPQWASILIYTVVTTIYTSLGGLKAVIWTDVFQLVIMFTGVFAVIVKSTVMTGGLGHVFELATSRLDMADFRVDPTVKYQFWNLTFGSTVVFLVSICQQPGIQRINSSPDIRSAKLMCAIAGVMYSILSFMICMEGVMIYAYYAYHECDPIQSGRIDSSNKLVPLIVADLFSSIPGLPGLFIASLSSAALSTLSSCLSSLGAITYDDFIRELFPNLKQKKATNISKCVVAVYGLVAMVFAFVFSKIPGSIMNISFAVMACLDGPMCAAFLLAIFYRRSTAKGVVIGVLVGISVTFWLNMNQILHPGFTTPPLPPASIDQCYIHDELNITGIINNSSNYIAQNTTAFHQNYRNYSFAEAVVTSFLKKGNDMFHTNSTITSMSPLNVNPSGAALLNTTVAPSDIEDTSRTFLEHIASISYTIFSMTGSTITLIVGILVSCCTSSPKTVDEIYLFSFDRHIRQRYFPKKNGSDVTEISVESDQEFKDLVPK